MSKKIIITESQFKYIIENHLQIISENELKEFEVTSHYEIDRLKQRFLNVESFDVKVYSKDFKYDDSPIGKWRIPEDLKGEIMEKLEYLKKFHIPGRSKIQYGIIVHTFDIKPEDCEFKNDRDRDQAILYYNQKSPLMIADPGTNSVGNIMLAIIDGDAVVSIIYERTHKGLNDIVNRKKPRYFYFKDILNFNSYLNASVSDRKGEKIKKKFEYNQGVCYSYEDLGNLHNEIDPQFKGMSDNVENGFDGFPDDYKFCFQILTPQQIKAQYPNIKMSDLVTDKEINNLIEKLKVDGLEKPPVGLSGEDVASAHVLMNVSMPYFEIRGK